MKFGVELPEEEVLQKELKRKEVVRGVWKETHGCRDPIVPTPD